MLNKIKWVLGVLLVFFLILATNLMDRKNFQVVQGSIEMIYQKQLMSKNILLELSTLVHEKAMANALADSSFYARRNTKVNSRIDELFVAFEEAELSYREERTLNFCREKFTQITAMEAQRLKDPQVFTERNRMADLAIELEEISENLSSLALIQLEEGLRQMMIGKQALTSIELLTKMEIIMLIAIAVLVQIFILYKPKWKFEEEEED